jgi:transcriptional regulator with XRE-family HTH domain
VAAAVNVSKSAIEMYECGARMPRDDVKEKMALFFGTTVGALFFGE